MPYEIVSDEYVTIGDVPLPTPAWVLLNLEDMWEPAPRRVNNPEVPLLDGEIAYPTRKDADSRSLEIVVYGWWDWEGHDAADPREQLETNLLHLEEKWCSGAVLEAVLHLP